MRHENIPIRTSIEFQGQSYVDEPVYETHRPKQMSVAVASAFDREIPVINQLVAYTHIKLNWNRPTKEQGGTWQRKNR